MTYAGIAIAFGLAGTVCHLELTENYLIIPMIYGICFFQVWAVILIVGVYVTSVALSGPNVLQNYCDNIPMTSNMDFLIDELHRVD
jgi:hypothetical protein